VVPRQGIVESNHLNEKARDDLHDHAGNKAAGLRCYIRCRSAFTPRRWTAARTTPTAFRTARTCPLTYLAGKLIGQQFLAILDEDIPRWHAGERSQSHRVDFARLLEPNVIAALEAFVKGGDWCC